MAPPRSKPGPRPTLSRPTSTAYQESPQQPPASGVTPTNRLSTYELRSTTTPKSTPSVPKSKPKASTGSATPSKPPPSKPSSPCASSNLTAAPSTNHAVRSEHMAAAASPSVATVTLTNRANQALHQQIGLFSGAEPKQHNRHTLRRARARPRQQQPRTGGQRAGTRFSNRRTASRDQP